MAYISQSLIVRQLCETLAAEAHVDHAVLVGHPVLALRRAELACTIGLVRGAVVEVWSVWCPHWCLPVEEQILLSDACGADAGTDLGTSVIARIAVEVAAVSVLARLRGHRNLRVDVVTLGRLVPPVDLYLDVQRQRHVHHVHLLARTVRLEDLAVPVGDHLHVRVLVGKLVREPWDDHAPVPGCRRRRDAEDVLATVLAVEERPADSDLLHDGQAVRHRGGHVAGLDPHRPALHEPVLPRRVKAGVAAVEGHHVRVSVDPAGTPLRRRRGWWRRLRRGRHVRWRGLCSCAGRGRGRRQTERYYEEPEQAQQPPAAAAARARDRHERDVAGAGADVLVCGHHVEVALALPNDGVYVARGAAAAGRTAASAGGASRTTWAARRWAARLVALLAAPAARVAGARAVARGAIAVAGALAETRAEAADAVAEPAPAAARPLDASHGAGGDGVLPVAPEEAPHGRPSARERSAREGHNARA
mmetsp:Transcript_112138/g.304409  ORF Transcript_112138/g.304409 Transcript_112138/m.304409 type:complete len:476 (+) Transcript_112138:58-1485(+)